MTSTPSAELLLKKFLPTVGSCSSCSSNNLCRGGSSHLSPSRRQARPRPPFRGRRKGHRGRPEAVRSKLRSEQPCREDEMRLGLSDRG